MLGLGIDDWNHIIVLFSIVGAVAAGVVGVSTYNVVQLQKVEAKDANDALERYKLSAQTQVAEAKKSASNALERANLLEKQAQELKAANLQLESRIQPRRLAGENAQSIVKALEAVPPLEIGIVSRMMDPEGADYAEDIASAFKAANWNTVRFQNWTRSDKGVFIATVEGTQIPQNYRIALTKGLDDAKIGYTFMSISGDDINRISPHFVAGPIYLLVGAKP